MRIRSTGLGKQEMVARIQKIEHQGDYLIMRLETTEPARWKVRVCVSYRDLVGILKSALKPSNIAFVLFGSRSYKNPKPPPEY